MALTVNNRTADHDIDPVFLERWSPRAYDGSAVPLEHLLTMVEAARWAPSSYNSQPWRFLYALRGGAHWEQFMGFLAEGNRKWCADAGALLVLLSKSTMAVPGQPDEVPSYSHSHDAGAGWACLALQATRMGYQAHGMVGFDRDRVFAELHVPAGFRVEQMIAVGRLADLSALPEERRAKEVPNNRRPVSQTAFEGAFPAG